MPNLRLPVSTFGARRRAGWGRLCAVSHSEQTTNPHTRALLFDRVAVVLVVMAGVLAVVGGIAFWVMAPDCVGNDCPPRPHVDVVFAAAVVTGAVTLLAGAFALSFTGNRR